MNYKSLDILVRCPQAPIPNLGQEQAPLATVTPGDAGDATDPSNTNVTIQAAPLIAGSDVLPVTTGTMATGHIAPFGASEGDDFADFQTAVCGPPPSSASFGDFAAVVLPTHTNLG